MELLIFGALAYFLSKGAAGSPAASSSTNSTPMRQLSATGGAQVSGALSLAPVDVHQSGAKDSANGVGGSYVRNVRGV